MRFIERIKRGHRFFVITRQDWADYSNPSVGEYAMSYVQFMWHVIRYSKF